MTEEKTNKTTALFTALLRAQSLAKAVDKSSKNTFHHYKYASAEDVLEAARPLLSEAGLIVMVSEYEVTKDTKMVRCNYLVAHAETGEKLFIKSDTPYCVDKGRPEDKAVACAKTYDISYMLRGLLLLPRVEKGIEPDDRDDRGFVPKLND